MVSPQSQTVFHVLGRRLTLIGCPDELIQALEADWLFVNHRMPEVAYNLTIRCGPGPLPMLNSGQSVSVHAMQQQIPLLVSGSEVVYAPGGVPLLLAHFGEESAEVRLCWPTPLTRPTLAALKIMVAESLRISGLLPLHAAVACKDGETCAFFGPSGTGKSTTVLRAIAAGWTALAEDFVWVDPDTAQVYGWDRGIRLLPESFVALPPEVAAQPWPQHADGKYWLPFTALQGHRMLFESQGRALTQLALLERRADLPSAWSDLPRRAALQLLWEAAGLAVTTLAVQRTGGQIAVLLPKVKPLRLVLGSTPLPL